MGPVSQLPDVQSKFTKHDCPYKHGGHEPPPQSLAVSSPFLRPSSHRGFPADAASDDVGRHEGATDNAVGRAVGAAHRGGAAVWSQWPVAHSPSASHSSPTFFLKSAAGSYGWYDPLP